MPMVRTVLAAKPPNYDVIIELGRCNNVRLGVGET